MTPAMLINSAIVLGMFVLVGFACGRRPGHLTTALAISLAVSLVLVAGLPKPDQLAAVLAVDAGVVAFMAHLARHSPAPIAEPARVIMAVGTFKITFAMSGVLLDMDHNSRAAARNGAFVLQVLVAGGMLDGLIAWLGHRGRIIGLGARRMFQHRAEGD